MKHAALLILFWSTLSKATPAVLSWENAHPERKAWSLSLWTEVDANYQNLKRAKDLPDFCPAFATLSPQSQKRLLSEIFVAMSYYESHWNPKLQFTEITMGKDVVTGKQIVSEGLFQLSYQDAKWYPSDCKFDPKLKNIVSYDQNIKCAVGIMKAQVDRSKAFKVKAGAYWSVLKISSSYNKIAKIQAWTKTVMPACRL